MNAKQFIIEQYGKPEGEAQENEVEAYADLMEEYVKAKAGHVDTIVNQPCMKSVRFEPANEPEIATIGAIMELFKDSDLSDAGKKRIIEYIADWVG